jgi:hypothetical protein
MSKYLLDANIFIQAKNLHYGFDFCPAFWDWLVQQNALGKVASIEKIADELAGEDDLSQWAAMRSADFFLPADSNVIAAFSEISAWLPQQNYEPAAISTFSQVADYWIVAHAKAHDWTVVTHEVPSNSTKKVKIPDVCAGLKIHCISPYAMLRREHARFVLGTRAAA